MSSNAAAAAVVAPADAQARVGAVQRIETLPNAGDARTDVRFQRVQQLERLKPVIGLPDDARFRPELGEQIGELHRSDHRRASSGAEQVRPSIESPRRSDQVIATQLAAAVRTALAAGA